MTTAPTPSAVERTIDAAALAPASVAILLGAFVLFGVAFAGPEVLHNAAHDSRHSLAFPCH